MRASHRFQRSQNALRLKPRFSASGIDLDLPDWMWDRSGRLLPRGVNRFVRPSAGTSPDESPETSFPWWDESGCGIGGGILYVSPDILLL